MSHKRQSVWIGGWEYWPCSHCRELKRPNDFGPNRTAFNGLQNQCKECRGHTPKVVSKHEDGRIKWHCKRCGEYKVREEMGIRRASPHGLNSYCLECLKVRRVEQWNKDIEHSRKLSRASGLRDAEKNRERIRAYMSAYYQKNKASLNERTPKFIAREAVRHAVYKGRMAKPDRCERCNEPTPKHLLHGHHEDYARKLDVEWLCPKCHGKENRLSLLVTRTN